MSEFDPYHRWLGIPPKHQPPNHYRLLGLELFASDPEVIRDAGSRQMAHVRTYQLGTYAALSQRILNELGAAIACLSNPRSKSHYDQQLGGGEVVDPEQTPLAKSPEATPPPQPTAPPEATPPEPDPPSAPEPASDPLPASPPVRGRVWVFGKWEGCDLIVDHETVSRSHCRLIETDGGLLLEDLGSTNGTYVNGRRIAAREPVSESDRITLGKLVPLPWPLVERRQIHIGRTGENDVVLAHDTVSARHAVLTAYGDYLLLEDLDSTNGTRVGNPPRKITRCTLSAEDPVFFGDVEIQARALLEPR